MELLLEEEFWHTRPQSLRTAFFPPALDSEWAEHMCALDVMENPQPVPMSEDTVLELLADALAALPHGRRSRCGAHRIPTVRRPEAIQLALGLSNSSLHRPRR